MVKLICWYCRKIITENIEEINQEFIQCPYCLKIRLNPFWEKENGS